MKKLFFLILLGVIFNANAQYNTPWTSSTNNTIQSGYIGIGTKGSSGASNTPLPNFNLQLHGTADYISSNMILNSKYFLIRIMVVFRSK